MGDTGETAEGDKAANIVRDEFIRELIEEAVHSDQRSTYLRAKKSARRILRSNSRKRVKFERRLRRRWSKGIGLYDLARILAEKIGSDYNTQHVGEAQAADDLTFYVVVRLHARACYIASEVRALMVSGHAHGALTRWRSLHEVAVVAMFIREHGRETARRYLAHEPVEALRAAKEYERHYTRLGYEPLPEGEVEQLQAAKDAAVAEFGPNFRSLYGWAAHALGTSPTYEPKFNDIEQAVNVQHLRPFYGMASQGVHAGIKGIRRNIGNLQPDRMLLAGPSGAGLADPGNLALISLLQCTCALVVGNTDMESAVGLPVLFQLVDEAGEAFHAAHEQLIREVEELEAEERARG